MQKGCIPVVPDPSISCLRVPLELTVLIAERSKQGKAVSDGDTELTFNAVLAWRGKAQVQGHYRTLGERTENAFVVSFIRRICDELLNETLFITLEHAREKIAGWIDDYDTEQPHLLLGYAAPTALAAELEQASGGFASHSRTLHYAAPCFTRAITQQQDEILIATE